MEEQNVSIEDSLYRRIYRTPWHKFVNPDNTPTSRNFVLRPKDQGRLSVDVARLTTKETAIKDVDKFALAEILVSDVRGIGLNAIYDPLDENIAHAAICGLEEDDDIKPAMLAKKAKIVFS
jgi:hypothetical protein